ncbi:MAG TPA: hypothetical protein VMF91_15980 [Bryobacteraceae bacterium]|nr:hypothetical protein [Bryobacteraceae bacterium]
MKRLSIYKKISPLVALMLLPAFLKADCVPSAPTDYTVPFKLVTMKNYTGTAYASYTTGSLTISDYSGILDFGTLLSATHLPQLFSGRTAPFCPGSSGVCLNEQPFDIYQADQLGVSVNDSNYISLKGVTNTITVTLTLESWGNGTQSFTGTCDAKTGELYGTFNDDTFAVMSFGTPEPPQAPPK